MNLYKLELGDKIPCDRNSSFTRVPGGWVYSDISGNCFIPYNEEFIIKKEDQKQTSYFERKNDKPDK